MAKFFPELSGRLEQLVAAFSGRRVAVVGHARPDGDCIGSQVGLARILQAAGHDVVCVNGDPVPRRLEYLVPGMPFLRPEGVPALPADLAAVFVDCADHARVGGRLQSRFAGPVGNIDHHLSNPAYAQVNLVDSSAAATSEILAGTALDSGLTIDPLAAQALYTGILTDTGQFRFSSTTRRCFVLAGELVAGGADPARIGYELYERESVGRLKLLQSFLASLRMECGGRVCIGSLDEATFKATGTGQEDTEGLVDYARSIDGVEIAALVERRLNGTAKASLRAKEALYRVDTVAAQFGGGGHACAAGLNVKAAPQDFEARLLAAIVARLAEIDGSKLPPH